MKLKLSKRTRLLLALLLILAVAAYSLWGQDAAPAPEVQELPAAAESVQPQPPAEPADETAGAPTDESNITGVPPDAQTPDERGSYTSKEDVALYLHLYGRLPDNFMTKSEARDLGWEGGSLEKYAPGMCIGGDRFGNYEGNLPKGNYTECDIDTLGASSRGAKRIVFSDDGRIYYTEDHYSTFTQLY